MLTHCVNILVKRVSMRNMSIYHVNILIIETLLQRGWHDIKTKRQLKLPIFGTEEEGVGRYRSTKVSIVWNCNSQVGRRREIDCVHFWLRRLLTKQTLFWDIQHHSHERMTTHLFGIWVLHFCEELLSSLTLVLPQNHSIQSPWLRYPSAQPRAHSKRIYATIKSKARKLSSPVK